MTELVSDAEKAIREMTWQRSSDTTPPGILRAFNGKSKDGWTAMVCVYKHPHSQEGADSADGAVTCAPRGLIIRMTAQLAEMAAGLAERATASV